MIEDNRGYLKILMIVIEGRVSGRDFKEERRVSWGGFVLLDSKWFWS